jgi:hypothetical protein
MFFDGEIYATISRNMAVGIGDAWHPVFSATHWADFREAPPLAFVLESLLFRLVGDHFWVEKLYSALTGLATAAMIVDVWRQLVDIRSPWRSYSWLPVLLWMMLPSWMTVYGNNLLEGTMGLFAILAVYAALRADEGGRAAFAWLPLAAASVAAALLSKGPVGLYPLATPILAGLTLRRQTLGKSAAMNAALIGLVGAMLGLLFLQAGALEGFTKYLHVQVFAALAGQRELTASSLGRFYIFREIVRELALPAAVAGALTLRSRRRGLANSAESATRNRVLAFCLLTAVSASFPIAISPKQENWYPFPSYPFYTLALGLWCAPALVRLLAAGQAAADGWLGRRSLKWAATCTLLVLVGVVWHALRHPPPEKELYRDTLALARVVPKSSVVSYVTSSNDVHTDAALPYYLARWAYIGVGHTEEPREFLVLPIDGSVQPPPGYRETPTEMRLYRLFKRSDSMNLVTEPVGQIGTIRVSEAIEVRATTNIVK